MFFCENGDAWHTSLEEIGHDMPWLLYIMQHTRKVPKVWLKYIEHILKYMEKFVAMREEKPWNWSWTVFIFKDDLPFPAMTPALRFEVIDPWTQESSDGLLQIDCTGQFHRLVSSGINPRISQD